jgi:hypothetical protein
MLTKTRYWFPAKKYGWGWGPPTAWQGWVVLLGAIVVMAWAAVKLLPHSPTKFGVVTVATVVVLTIVCYVTGEPPSWRWGDDK